MPRIIKDGAIIDDGWTTITDKTIRSADQLPAGNMILPLAVWLATRTELAGRTVGVWLDSDEPPAPIKESCQQLPLVAINFPIFSDGRGYSYAQILRSQYGYRGELRAMGDVLRDQLFYLKRSGFNSFAMRADQKIDEAVAHLRDFSETYQGAIDNPLPLFRRR